ncbi:MAG TPA: alkaline phosphatase [Candidatus Acidoferrales bacterium]|nr:alkaline phosphatase [Candidatus Acidoferrales bacterium]
MRATTIPVLCAALAGMAGAQTTGRHVIVIGVDGLSVDGVKTAKAPRLHQLIERSAWTLEARGVMPTLSSPNWASVIDGAGPEQHGITSNGYLRKLVEFEPVCRDGEGMFPTIFEILRAQRPSSRIAIFHEWSGFADLVEKHVADVMQHEHSAARTTAAAVEYWKRERPDLMFVHLDLVDHAGHDSGWTSRAYYQAVEEADTYIGSILDLLQAGSATDSTYVLVTSDHGGRGRGHGKNTLAEIQIPWVLSGPEVVPGKLAASVYTYDSAATIAWILGINAHECWIGRPVLSAFRPAAGVTHNSSDCAPQHPTLGAAGPAALALRVR